MSPILLVSLVILLIAIFLAVRLLVLRKNVAELEQKTDFAIKGPKLMKVTFDHGNELDNVATHFNTLIDKFHSLEKSNESLEVISKDKKVLDSKVQQFEESLSQMNLLTSIGKQITGNLNLDQIFMTLFEYVKSSMDLEDLELLYFEEGKPMVLHMNKEGVQTSFEGLTEELSAMHWSLENNREIVLNDAQNDYGQYLEKPIHSFSGNAVSSIICIPLKLHDAELGALGVASLHKNVYNEYHAEFLRTLASYLAVALDNSRVYQLLEKGKEEIEDEKAKSDRLLLNILPAEIAEELKEKGEAAARKFDEVSILFTDFKNFTETSRALTPEHLVKELNDCFKEFDAICERHGIEKIKTIGDSFMAAGGIPIPKKEAVVNTVLAGIEMAEFIEKRKERSAKEGLIPFEMRIGINTGPVVAGIVGSTKFQYDIWGDAVNLASRMESTGTIGLVNISEYTHQLIKNEDQFEFEYRGKIDTKGRGAIDMYFVTKKAV